MTQSITTAQVRAIAGKNARSDLVNAIVRGWPEAARVGKITTPRRAAHFLSQIMTETGGLQILSESGAYSERQILKIFGAAEYSKPLGGRGHSAGIGPAEAKRIASLPVAQRGPALFNRVYGTGNPKKAKEFNNTGPNDGWLYRGGGMMQCTGKSNYAAMAKKTGLPLVEHPELLHNPDSAFKAAYLEWAQDGRCNAAADRNNVVEVRKIINGGDNGIAETKRFLAIALNVLLDYEVGDDDPAPTPFADLNQHADPVAGTSNEEDGHLDLVPMPEPRPAAAPPNVQPEDTAVGIDPILLDVQKRLKQRRYPPGILDGKWGSGTRGAISGFMNDRGNRLEPMPTSLEEFHEVADQVRDELLEAETEVQADGSVGWYRPVSEARANADPKIVKELAPEVAPQRRNFLTILWGMIVTGAGTVYTTISGYVSQVYDFFTDHEDVIDGHPEVKSAVWDWVTSVPVGAWLFVGFCVLSFILYNSWQAIHTSTQAVKNGERQ